MAAAMKQLVSDEGLRQAAVELGAKIREEDGVEAAVRLIESEYA